MLSRLKFKPKWLALPALALLTSCGAGTFNTDPTLTTPIAQCYPVVPYTPAQESAQASAYDALPPSSPLRSLIDDYGHERAALRACAGVK